MSCFTKVEIPRSQFAIARRYSQKLPDNFEAAERGEDDVELHFKRFPPSDSSQIRHEFCRMLKYEGNFAKGH